MRITTSLGLISTALLVAGCADQPTAHTYTYTEYPNGEVVTTTTRYNQEAADRALEAACRQDLNRYGDLASVSPNVQIIARSGLVTLRGTIPSERDRQMIDTCVKNSAGVASVDDQLRVGYPATGTYSQTTTVYGPPSTTVYQPAPAPVVTTAPSPSPSVVVVSESAPAYERSVQVISVSDTDRDLAERIADSIRAQAVFSPSDANLTVRVAAGRVDVRGTVEHAHEKHNLLEAVRHTPGVIETKDHVHVR